MSHLLLTSSGLTEDLTVPSAWTKSVSYDDFLGQIEIYTVWRGILLAFFRGAGFFSSGKGKKPPSSRRKRRKDQSWTVTNCSYISESFGENSLVLSPTMTPMIRRARRVPMGFLSSLLNTGSDLRFFSCMILSAVKGESSIEILIG